MFPGGTLDPNDIPKYAIPLVFPPVMPNTGTDNDYAISVRQFEQQILPGGLWREHCLATLKLAPTDSNPVCDYPATTVWSYGPTQTPIPVPGSRTHVAPDDSSGFNYPSWTVETTADVPVDVRWSNELVRVNDATGFPYPEGHRKRTALQHLFAVDQTLHWANPPKDCAFSPEHGGTVSRTDCAGRDPRRYRGPVPIVSHLHGAHVNPNSDGYPESWWLPVARATTRFPADYATSGTFFDDATGSNPGNLGYADYSYRNDQAATTLWFHDHSLGITRLNVYAGPAGFWLIRGGPYDVVNVGGTTTEAVLPGPAPERGQTVTELNTPGSTVRGAIREVPVLIQDRSFNRDGSLFYPESRSYFETLDGTRGKSRRQFRSIRGPRNRPYIGKFAARAGGRSSFKYAPAARTKNRERKSMIPPTWNVETFFNTMVVNGVAWPTVDVAPARYRLRFLNASNTRSLNLAFFYNTTPGTAGAADQCPHPTGNTELPAVQIGSDGGFLAQPVEILTGYATALPGDGAVPTVRTPSQPGQAILLGVAERADVIVDFSGLPDGTIVRLANTAPDSPFGGFGKDPIADCSLTGQVMEFVVNSALTVGRDTTTTSAYAMQPVSPTKYASVDATSKVSLNEMNSDFGISHNREPVYLPKNRRADVGTVPDDGYYPVCAQKKCTRQAIATPACAADDSCPPGLTVSGFDPDSLTCWDPNDGQNAYQIFQKNFDVSTKDTDDPQCADPKLSPDHIYGPMVDLLGTVTAATNDANLSGVGLRWTDDSGDSQSFAAPVTGGGEVMVEVTEYPALNSTEAWEIYNFTPDAHPIHLHLVQFNVNDRQPIPGDPTKTGYHPSCEEDCIDAGNCPMGWVTDSCYDPSMTGVVFPQEEGWKDTVIAYPGTVTTVWAKFDIPGLFVWHCHILEHEDNEMMRPFFVVAP
ncbi:MAG: multicopper oxidase domain-containing protein [Myxococcota bacterium]